MNLAIQTTQYNNIKNIYKRVSKIPFFDLLYSLPMSVEDHGDVSVLMYDTEFETFRDYFQMNRGDNNTTMRDFQFYKKHLSVALEKLHSQNIFAYFNINHLNMHSESAMPLLCRFEKSIIMDFEKKECRDEMIELFAKPIGNKYIPFSLFIFHFIAFSLHKQNRFGEEKEVSIYQLYDSNESEFIGWNQKDLDEVERIVVNGKNYDGIFDCFLQDKGIWFQWDNIIMERSIAHMRLRAYNYGI